MRLRKVFVSFAATGRQLMNRQIRGFANSEHSPKEFDPLEVSFYFFSIAANNASRLFKFEGVSVRGLSTCFR
jgi:hypothetical protein